MVFLHPNALYFMLPPLVILFLLLLTQKEKDEHFFTLESIEKLRVASDTLTLKARNALFFMVGIFIIIALANPVIKDTPVEVTSKSADIMVALDISDSMLASDVYPNRLKLAKQKILTLLDEAKQDRIGVLAFAKNSYLVSPFSFDHGAVKFLVSKLDTDSITQQGTNYMSLLKVLSNLDKEDSKKYLLILSDGGDEDDFSQEIDYAKKNNIVVSVLAIGTKKGAPIKQKDGTFIKYKGNIIISKLNTNISSLATQTGGVYVQNTTSSEDIKRVVKEIVKSEGEKTLQSKKVQRYQPLFYYPLAIALLFLLIATSSLRVKSKSTNLILVAFMFSIFTQDSRAGVLDFLDLKDAQTSYGSKDYGKSASIYEKYAKKSDNPQAYYDAGNAYYKDKKYDKALKSYKDAYFKDENQRAKQYANIGNTYVKLGKKDSLKEAIKAYEKSLKLKEDKDVRENLEAVKKFLEKQKKKQKQKQQQKNKKNQKNKNQKKQNKDSKNKNDKNKDKKSGDKSDKKKSSDKNKKSDKKSSDKDKKSQKQKSDNASKQDKNKNAKDEKKKKGSKDEKVKPLDAKKNNSKNLPTKGMSEREVKKWLGRLNKQKNTYLYRLDTQKQQEKKDEKPW